ncbi:MAG: response regulator [Firmicutes bacterium]|nr:response regulator [Bacillota bacterium]
MEKKKKGDSLIKFVAIGIVVVSAILLLSTIWMGQTARQANEQAVRSVSMMYLDELTGRREQVVESNLNDSIEDIENAVQLLDSGDLSSLESLQAFQERMKKVFESEKFAFVDTNGLIYTAQGTRTDIDSYPFDYKTLTGPEIAVKDPTAKEKKVIIAVPINPIDFLDQHLTICFMERDMQRLLEGLSLQSDTNETTFCNIYTRDGVALTNLVLGGLASEDNLLEAMEVADMEKGFSQEAMEEDFAKGREGVVSFDYNGIQETMYYTPVKGTDWMLTYLIRESVITDKTTSISQGILRRSILLTLLTALVMLGFFGNMIAQTRRTDRLAMEKETAAAESRIKQEELEQRLALQEQLLEQEKQRVQQDSMITALASDYRSVFYIDLDTGEGVCYRADPKRGTTMKEGERFPFGPVFTAYAGKYVSESYRDGFRAFISPETIRKRLDQEPVISYRYLVEKDGKESFEMLRMAGVRKAGNRKDGMIHAVGAGFVDVDHETRADLERSQALSDALAEAEQANKAKTAFLSNMSHEIRTPMNAIIGLDSIALNEPDVPERTRGHLEKIGDSARHLLDLINDILDMSRIESGRLTLSSEEFSFSKLLEQINTLVSGQCHEKGLQFDCTIHGDIDDYYIGDSMKLKQVIINILSNAVKFTPEGGSVFMDVERTAQYEGKSVLRFIIKDTGIGMDKKFLPKIFDAFSQEDSSTTNKYGSTGLGMAITKSIVEMMNGHIQVESEKGKGTTFTVSVTLLDSDRSGEEAMSGEIRPQDLSVLVVDDDEVACEHAKLVLDKVGISSEIALSGSEALEMVRLRHARMEPYNLILLDWKMPEMDGVETARRIREIVGNDSAILILTAYKWDDVLEEALEAGVDSFLAKPLFASNVVDEFSRAIRRKGLAGVGIDRKAELSGRKILLAEDMLVNAEIMKEVLKMREMEADHAENGRIAVEKYLSQPEGYYDAVLMDMRMPEMDGLTATEKIRTSGRADAKIIPIIALTANAFDEDVERSLQAGLNAHLSKPVEPDTLFSTLESLIGEAESRTEA